jgi:hypothetical protein
VQAGPTLAVHTLAHRVGELGRELQGRPTKKGEDMLGWTATGESGMVLSSVAGRLYKAWIISTRTRKERGGPQIINDLPKAASKF